MYIPKIDVFKFFENKITKQIYINSYLLNRQLKDCIKNDMIIRDNILFLDEIFSKLNENKPKEYLENILSKYNEKIEMTTDYKLLLLDYGKVKRWKDDIKVSDEDT